MNEKVILAGLLILIFLVAGCTQTGTENSDYPADPEIEPYTLTAEQLAKNPEQYLSDGQNDIFKQITLTAILEGDHFKSTEIKTNGTLMSSIHTFAPDQEYVFFGVLFKNNQGEYEFWFSNTDAPLASPDEIQTSPNPDDAVKSTAQTEGQLIQDLVKAIKKSFELN